MTTDGTGSFQRTQPQSEHAEMALLSCALQDPGSMAAAQDRIPSPEAFHQAKHAAIWEAAVELADQGGRVHLTALEANLDAKGMLGQVGGADYLIDLYDLEARPTADAAQSLAQVVVDAYTKRRMIEASAKIMQGAYDSPDSASEQLDAAQAEILGITEAIEGKNSSVGCAPIADLMQADAQFEAGEPMPTGYYDLDDMLSGHGLRPGQLVVIGARPSMGKTSMMLGLTDGLSSRGAQTSVHSLEMSRGELALRMLSTRSRVKSDAIERGDLIPRSMDEQNVAEGREYLARLPLVIDDTPGLTLMQLRARVRRAQAEHGVKVVMVDYLQLMTPDKAHSREQAVADMSRGLKQLAREFGVALVLLSQLNRQAENRDGHRPRMSDLRESGSIEQDADIIMLLHRNDYYAKQADRSHVPDGLLEVIIAKQRNGPTGVVRLHFNEDCSGVFNADGVKQGEGDETLYGAR